MFAEYESAASYYLISTLHLILFSHILGRLYPSIISIFPSICGLSLVFSGLVFSAAFGVESWGGSWTCPVWLMMKPSMSSRWSSETSIFGKKRKNGLGEMLLLPLGCREPHVDKWKPVSRECSFLLALSSEVFMSHQPTLPCVQEEYPSPCWKACQLQCWASPCQLRYVTVHTLSQGLVWATCPVHP